MSIWRGEIEDARELLNIVYKDEEEEQEESSQESSDEWEFSDGELELAGDKDPRADYLYSPYSSPERWEGSQEAPPYSPLPSSVREGMPQLEEQTAPRDRSRSPINVVLQVFDKDEVGLDDAFLAPDTHALYVSSEERDRDVRNRRRTSGRRGVRGVRGQSARGGGYPNRGHRGGHQWEVGHPLNEIWTNDQEVPPELVSLVTDVLRRQQMRMQDAARVERNAEREDARESENDAEFLDASDGEKALPRLEGQQNLHFEWASAESFQGQEENFTPEHTGSVFVHNSAYDAFRSYWTDDALDLIVAEANLHATKIASATFQSEWSPTNIHEILCLFAFWTMLGIVRMPTITSCFSVDPLLKTEVFRRMFTRKRYEMLNRALNFVESDPPMNDPSTSNTGTGRFDQLHHLRPIITHLNSRFQSNYILRKDICIDESRTLWEGRLNFKQYIRSKASKYGIKIFELCESTTGYLWSFIVYTGKQSATDLEQSTGVLKSTAIVRKLIGPLLNKGYRLFMDNSYNSPLLARYLKLNGTDCVGTLSPSCRDVPVQINKAPLKRGEYIVRHSGDVSVLAWQDKKRITMISTCHGSSCALPTVSSRPLSRPVPFKPQVVLDYNKFMGGVDTKDHMLEPYLLERKHCKKWYMKLFKHLINVSILNSRILLQSSTSKHHDHLAFRLELVDSILTIHLSHCPRSRRYTACTASSSILPPYRFTSSTHWPVLLEPTASSAARNRNTWKYCVVCIREGRKTQRTPYCCESCHVPLCIKNCFKSYHTSP